MAKKELTSAELAILDNAYPVSTENVRMQIPRFGMLSKDIEEVSGTGKNKKTKVLESAGTFYTERDLGEVSAEGKKVWTKEFLGEEVEVIIAFERRQLRRFDKGLNKFISSPVFDSADQVISLFLDKRPIAKGTAAELQALYPKMTEKGKKSSSLNEEKILYVIYKGELYQCNLSTSSKWSFADYKRQVSNPSKFITTLSSIEETNGSNTYRKMTFKSKGFITADDLEIVQENQSKLNEEVQTDASRLLESASKEIVVKEELDEYGNEKMK